ncbi:MAG TPA: tetratricopeptide repeat protein [Gemmataceae bacterium]|nr:tetratricopeptide repeat protein [Gemmataceae bacterium]
MSSHPNASSKFSRDPKGSASRPALPFGSRLNELIRRRRRLVLSVAVLGLGVGLGTWLWPRTVLEPPQPDMAEVDPEVAETIAAARSKVRQQPNSGAAWGRLGMVFLAHDFHEEAQRSFAQAERLDASDARWPYLRGLSLTRTNPEEGIPCLQRAAERCGDDPLAPRLRLAEALLNQGRLDEAALNLEQARKKEPHHARVQLGLGRLAVLRGQWNAAREYLDSCSNDVHTRRLAHTLLAEAWTRLGDTDKAREEQRQADEAPEDQLWLDPFIEDVMRLQRGLSVRLQRAVDLFAQKRYRQGVELLEETAKRYPRSSRLRLLLGDIWRKLGRPDQAEEALTEAVRVDPDSPDAWFRLGCIQAARNRPREAADSFRRTIRLKPDHADAYFNLGHRLKELGDSGGAVDAFRAALRCRPDHDRARQALVEMDKNK